MNKIEDSILLYTQVNSTIRIFRYWQKSGNNV